MKFIVDAQLPVSLSYPLKSMGQDAIHTKELTLKNATPDTEINTISIIPINKKSPSFEELFYSEINLSD